MWGLSPAGGCMQACWPLGAVRRAERDQHAFMWLCGGQYRAVQDMNFGTGALPAEPHPCLRVPQHMLTRCPRMPQQMLRNDVL